MISPPKVNVLVIGRHADMLTKVVTLLNQENYNALGKLTNEEALKAFETNTIQAVIIGGGVDSESRDLFHREFLRLNPNVKLIDAHPSSVLNDLKKALNH